MPPRRRTHWWPRKEFRFARLTAGWLPSSRIPNENLEELKIIGGLEFRATGNAGRTPRNAVHRNRRRLHPRHLACRRSDPATLRIASRRRFGGARRNAGKH